MRNRSAFTPLEISRFKRLQPRQGQSESKTGFTLIETIIYAALLSVIISLVIGAVYQIIEGSDKLQRNITTDAEAHFLMRKIEWALTGVSAINLPASGSIGASLSVDKVNYSQNPVVFDLDSGNVRIKKGTDESVILNSENVTVSDLQFQHLAAGLYRPAAVKTSFNINSKPYSTTIYLRK